MILSVNREILYLDDALMILSSFTCHMSSSELNGVCKGIGLRICLENNAYYARDKSDHLWGYNSNQWK